MAITSVVTIMIILTLESMMEIIRRHALVEAQVAGVMVNCISYNLWVWDSSLTRQLDFMTIILMSFICLQHFNLFANCWPKNNEQISLRFKVFGGGGRNKLWNGLHVHLQIMSDNAFSEKELLVTLRVVGLLVLYQHLLVLKLMLAVKLPHHACPFFFALLSHLLNWCTHNN